MELIINPPVKEWETYVKRPDFDEFEIMQRVTSIVSRVRESGDVAIRELSEEIDGVRLGDLEVTQKEKQEAGNDVPNDVKSAIEMAIEDISAFHRAQKFDGIEVETRQGVVCRQKAVPITKVGIYIPGGTAPLFSTVLMLAIPAKIAGCKQIVMCTPTDKNGNVPKVVLYAAVRCGVDHIFKVGGAQAVAAMAYGTATVTKVDKIFGPGNRYVTNAKKLVAEKGVAIDMVAGPSEVLVLADDWANPSFVASDLLSQAEHGADSQVCLVCGSEGFASEVRCETEAQLEKLLRKEIAAKALSHSYMLVFDSLEDRIAFANLYAPEHLIIACEDADAVAEEITNAGSVFIGDYSPESAGDYASGTNHTLPTSGTAISSNGVNLDSFVRKVTFQKITKDGLSSLGKTIITMAEAEGLEGHANAVRVRLLNK